MFIITQFGKIFEEQICSDSLKCLDHKSQIPDCDFVGKSKLTMAVHIGKNHSEEFDCGLCDLETNSLQNLETHLKTCEAYECDYYTGCDKRFNTLSEIKKHFKDQHKKEKGSFKHLKIDRNYCNEVSETVHEFEKN